MRIAYFSHFYPPAACGGAGYYTAALANGFVQRGHEVGVLCIDGWGEGARYFNGFRDEVEKGVHVRRLFINWKKAPRPFDWLYDSPVTGEQAGIFLAEFKPDVVHVSSTLTLSARSVLIAKESGFPVVLHQHDYWSVCARHTLLHKDGRICSGPETPQKCQQCLLDGTKIDRLMTSVLSAALRTRLYENLGGVSFITRQPGLIGMLGDLHRRRQVTTAVMKAADIIITPTAFAQKKLETYGLPSHKITVIPYGTELEWVSLVKRQDSAKLRLGFLGNVIRVKGVHLLIDAYEALLRQGADVELAVWGETSLEPDYFEALRLGASSKILWGGRYEKEDLPAILSNIDVLIVPSIWYETQGIVIQEAFAAKVPVIVSAGTSLTETVQHEVDGLYFKQGSVSDLVAQVMRLLSESQLLPSLRENIRPVRSIQQDLRQLALIYGRLRQRTSGEPDTEPTLVPRWKIEHPASPQNS